MRIVQMLPTLSYGDAVGNHTLALDDFLRDSGYETAIYAKNIDKRIKRTNVFRVDKYIDREDTFILYHLSIGDELNRRIKTFKARIIINYHNVTPGQFFEGYSDGARELCKEGVKNVRDLADIPVACICDSEFNKRELKEMGYRCPITVIPILIPFEDYKQKPNSKIIDKYSDGYTNIIFAGRVAPNKKQEDLIASFYYYHTYINPKSRLIIVGSFNQTDKYYRKLRAYRDELELDSVIFTGHIPFKDILAYYRVADIFLCLSEHEGFCVPLVEAMLFKVPIIAYDATAIGDTLGGSAVLLDDKDPRVVAETIHKVASDDSLKGLIIENENVKLKDYDNKLVEKKFSEKLEKIVSEYK